MIPQGDNFCCHQMLDGGNRITSLLAWAKANLPWLINLLIWIQNFWAYKTKVFAVLSFVSFHFVLLSLVFFFFYSKFYVFLWKSECKRDSQNFRMFQIFQIFQIFCLLKTVINFCIKFFRKTRTILHLILSTIVAMKQNFGA